MKILGIDPGIERLGFAVIEEEKDKEVSIIEIGCFKTSKKDVKQKRLSEIFSFVQTLIQKHSPQQFVLEKVFFAKNVKTALDIAEVRGALLVLAHQHKLDLKEFTPLQIKQSVTGNGRASKHEVFKILQLLFKNRVLPNQDDAIDALAITLCGLYHKDFRTP